MLDHSLGQQAAGQVANDLMDLYYSCASWIGVEALRFNHRIDLSPLPHPVLADGLASVDPASFHAIGPIDLWVHGGKNGLNVAAIKRGIDGQKQITVCHRPPFIAQYMTAFVKDTASQRNNPQIDSQAKHAA